MKSESGDADTLRLKTRLSTFLCSHEESEGVWRKNGATGEACTAGPTHSETGRHHMGQSEHENPSLKAGQGG